jgi:hypothetical protein
MTATPENKNQWLENHADLVAACVTLLAFLARLWAASGTFLNPDEALHFRLANQVSLNLAYRQSLTASHPPLLILVLYFWRALGTSSLWLRMPSILAGVVFCWMFYKWLSNAAGKLAGMIGLLMVALLPPVVLLTSEVRQYALELAFLASALYLLDEAFAKKSPGRMAASSLCLYFAMLSQYSAFWFAAALGLYALFRIFTERPPARLFATWAIGQLGGLSLALLLFETHIAKLGIGESRMAWQGWMSDYYLSHSYFDRAHDNPIVFLAGHSFGVFQYFCGQLVVGDVMGLLFVAGVALLLRGKGLPQNQDQASARRLASFLVLCFAAAMAVSLAHMYPYGGVRHVAFLMIPGFAGVAVAMERLAAGRWARGLAAAMLVLVLCAAFGKARAPRMDRTDQSLTRMDEAMQFLRQNADPRDLIFTDYQSDLLLGDYLCQHRPLAVEASSPEFEVFSCAGRRVVSASFRTNTFAPDSFANLWTRMVADYRLKPGDTVWVFQGGWVATLPEDLQKNVAEFHDLHFESFGNNIKIFKMTVGQPMPVVANGDTK